MIIETFSQKLINSGIFRLYTATGFFATLIFFILNADLFSPVEMILGIILVTILLQGLNNLMFSFIVKYFTFEGRNSDFNKRYDEEKINKRFNKLSEKNKNEAKKLEESKNDKIETNEDESINYIENQNDNKNENNEETNETLEEKKQEEKAS